MAEVPRDKSFLMVLNKATHRTFLKLKVSLRHELQRNVFNAFGNNIHTHPSRYYI